MILNNWMVNHFGETGRGLHWGTIQAISCKDWGIQRRKSFKKVGALTEIRNGHISNTNLKRYSLTNLIRYYVVVVVVAVVVVVVVVAAAVRILAYSYITKCQVMECRCMEQNCNLFEYCEPRFHRNIWSQVLDSFSLPGVCKNIPAYLCNYVQVSRLKMQFSTYLIILGKKLNLESKLREPYTHTHNIHMYVYIYVCVCVYIYIYIYCAYPYVLSKKSAWQFELYLASGGL